jgi:hypothetical protein
VPAWRQALSAAYSLSMTILPPGFKDWVWAVQHTLLDMMRTWPLPLPPFCLSYVTHAARLLCCVDAAGELRTGH